MGINGACKGKGHYMNNRLHIPGFPPPEQQDIVRFHVLKKLSYSKRIMLFILFILTGFMLQVLTLKVWPGALFLICAVVLILVRGYDSRVRLKTFNLDSRWTKVDMDRIHLIEELDEKAAKWDRDPLDISNATGFLMFLLTSFILIFVSMVTGSSYSLRRAGRIFTSDAVILVLPLWFNGIRRILKQGNLRIKADILKQMEAHFRAIKKDGENFNPLLMLAKDRTGKSVPTDLRFTVTFDDMPDDFYGIQAQTNLNMVEGKSYPYFYCVIAAKPGFGLRQYAEKMSVPKGITIEYDEDDNAEVIIIRKYTTKTSGYHTKINDCRRILEKSLVETRIILSATRGGKHG